MDNLTYKQGWNDERKLLRKMSVILGEVGAIPKTGFNKFHQYYYHSESDVNKAFQTLFSKHLMVLIPSIVSSEMREHTTNAGKIEYIQKARMLFTIMDAETGESLSSYMEGEGQDNGDKALFKSISGTQKYFLMKTFCIQDQNDPEADTGVDERNAATPNKQTTSKPPQEQKTTQTTTQQSTGSTPQLISAPQIGYCHKLKKDKSISDIDFMKMVSELGNGKDSIKDMTKQEASAFITLLNNYAA